MLYQIQDEEDDWIEVDETEYPDGEGAGYTVVGTEGE